ncbi:MAG: hypothetical protein GC154_05140 [bacterium]|nr:hypothetical protein [bacterium]
MNQAAGMLHSIEKPFVPFHQMYQRHGFAVRLMTPVEPDAIPAPYHDLLVHERDMTNTLAAWFNMRIHLRVIHMAVDGDVLSRMVTLELDSDNRPVEFGAIQIDLSLLDPTPRRLVEEARMPFGGILNEFAVEYLSQPAFFFRAESDSLMQKVFSISAGPGLYGRCNTLSVPSGRALAHVIEILPPMTDGNGGV